MSDSDDTYSEFVEALNNHPDKNEDYWDFWLKESRRTFDEGVKSLKESRAIVMDLIKIDLLLTSVVFAILNIQESAITTEEALLPGFFFVLSLITLILAYNSSHPQQ